MGMRVEPRGLLNLGRGELVLALVRQLALWPPSCNQAPARST
jgi:hypothetical protein